MTDSLILHRAYNSEEAVASLASSASRLELCDGDFIAVPGAIIGMFTHGAIPGATVETPDTIVWRPRRLDYAPDEEYPFLPRAARDAACTCKRKHHIFLRHLGEHRYFYLGLAHLGSYGGSLVDPTARFMLDHKLSVALWIGFGGYAEWQVTTHTGSHELCLAQLHRLRELLSEAFSSSHSHITLTRYQQDSLQCFTNPERAWFMYLRAPGDSGLYLSDMSTSGKVEHFACDCGTSLDFPRSRTADHATAIRILTDFFSSGELPSWVAWTEEG
jgi:hypothetical protein